MITRKVFFLILKLYILREKFGLHSVDFDDPSRPRTPKASSQFLRSSLWMKSLSSMDLCFSDDEFFSLKPIRKYLKFVNGGKHNPGPRSACGVTSQRFYL